MFNKEAYRQLCLTEKTIPLFSRDWWLDAVCGRDKWDVIWIEQGGQVQATCPLFIPHKGIVSMPPFTQTMGPWLAPVSGDTKYTSMLSHRQELCKKIVDEIKGYPHFLQNFSSEITDWLPFYWKGFTQTTRYTYLLPAIKDREQLWENMSQHTRRHITKARDKHAIEVRQGVSAEEFCAVYAKTFQRQGRSSAPHRELLQRLVTLCRERGQGDVWGGYDEKGNLHAAVFIAWQESAAYYIAGGGDPAYRDSGAHSYIMWEAIQAMGECSDSFDFEGSMLPGVERFFREFGARQTPYFTISKGKLSLIYKAWLKIKSFV
ncbi:GNAT family N-acetyltransferase [Parabacteroides sp. OttesenSCG-928-G06]|nr:GNAT family N-acetyltransferase [Parabacteroides sp. OttesenSCG-928-G06]